MTLITDFLTVWYGGHIVSEIALVGAIVYLLLKHDFKTSFIYGVALYVIHEGEWIVVYLLRGYPADVAQFLYPLGAYGIAVWIIMIYFFLTTFILKDVDWHALARMAIIMMPYFVGWFAIGLPTYGNAFGPTQYVHGAWANAIPIGSWLYGCVAMVWAYEHPSIFREKPLQDDFNWNLDLSSYRGKYIAIYDKKIIGSGDTSGEALNMAKTANPQSKPSLAFIPESEDVILRERCEASEASRATG